MSETDVQAATSTVDCKIPGCPEAAVSRFGPGAGLCHRHRGEAKQGLIEVPPPPTPIASRCHTPPQRRVRGPRADTRPGRPRSRPRDRQVQAGQEQPRHRDARMEGRPRRAEPVGGGVDE